MWVPNVLDIVVAIISGSINQSYFSNIFYPQWVKRRNFLKREIQEYRNSMQQLSGYPSSNTQVFWAESGSLHAGHVHVETGNFHGNRVSKNREKNPQNGWWKKWKTLLKMDDLGGHAKPPIFGNNHIRNFRWITSKGDIQNHPRSWAYASQNSGVFSGDFG